MTVYFGLAWEPSIGGNFISNPNQFWLAKSKKIK